MLSANAGSGKTSVLVERFVASVVQDGLRADQVLAITFTEKAAGELRARVRARLLELGHREAAREAEAAWITTFHGFCARILRAHAVAAGLDPGFAVLDPADGRAAQREAFEAALADFLAAPRADALDLAAGYTVDRLQRMVVAAHDELRSRGQTRPTLPPRRAADADAARAELERACSAFAAELAAAGAGAAVDAAREALAACRAALDAGAPVHPKGAKVGRNANALKTPAADAYRAACDAHARRAAPIGSPSRRSRSSTSCWGATPTPTRRPSAPAAASTSTTSSCSRATCSPASRASPPATASASSASWSTSSRTRTPCSSSCSSSWRATTPARWATSCRRSTPSAMPTSRSSARAAARLQDGGPDRRRWPPTSARARRSCARSTAPSDRCTSTGSTCAPGARTLPRPRRVVELLVTDADAWNGDAPGALGLGLPAASPVKQAEARLVAQRVAALVHEEGVAPRDVVVLLRASAEMGLYERALELAGLPTLAAGGSGWWGRQQIRDLCHLLAALANPRDEEALLGLLASPMAGLSSDAPGAARARRARGRHDDLGGRPRRRADARARGRAAPGRVPRVVRGRARARAAPRARRGPPARACAAPATTCTCSRCRAGRGGWPTSTSCCAWPPPTRRAAGATCAASSTWPPPSSRPRRASPTRRSTSAASTPCA